MYCPPRASAIGTTFWQFGRLPPPLQYWGQGLRGYVGRYIILCGYVKATETRTNEKKANLAAIEDSKTGQTATKNAIKVLKEFYDKQGAGLVQVKQVPEMEALTKISNTFLSAFVARQV